jgi:hypothetical protein
VSCQRVSVVALRYRDNVPHLDSLFQGCFGMDGFHFPRESPHSRHSPYPRPTLVLSVLSCEMSPELRIKSASNLAESSFSLSHNSITGVPHMTLDSELPLAGHSMGGKTAMAMCQAFAPRVESAIIVGALRDHTFG